MKIDFALPAARLHSHRLQSEYCINTIDGINNHKMLGMHIPLFRIPRIASHLVCCDSQSAKWYCVEVTNKKIIKNSRSLVLMKWFFYKLESACFKTPKYQILCFLSEVNIFFTHVYYIISKLT